MKSIKLTSLFLLIIIPFIGQTQTEWKTLETESYSVSYPSNWVFRQGDNQNFSLIDKERDRSFYIGFKMIDFRGTLEEYEQEVLSALDHTTTVIREEIKHEKIPFKRLFIIGTNDNPAEKIRIDERFAFYQNQLVVFSFYYYDDEKAEDFEKVIRKIFNSLKLN